MSSGSSLGSLASSRGSLNTSSRGSLSSLSSSELYYSSQGDQLDADYQCKLDFLLQEKGGYIPSGPITTIHEHEVAKSPSQPGQGGPCGAAAAATGHTAPLTEAPKSVTSLSSRSSLSSLSPPGSPLVLEGTFPMSPHDVPLHQFSADFEDCELSSHFADIGLGENQILLDSDSKGAARSLLGDKELADCAGELLYEGPADVEKSLPKRRGIHLLGEKSASVSAAVSDESVAGDSGVYEAFVKQPSEVEDVTYSEEDVAVVETAQVQIGLRYDAKRASFMVIIAQLRNLHAFLIPHTSKVYFRVALLPSSTDVSCLFRTKVHPATESMLFNDMFRVAIAQTALQQKTLRVDLCSVSKHRGEECLDAVSALLARTSAELLAVEQELAQEEEPGQEEEQRGPEGDWLTMLREASDEIVAEEEAEVKLPEGSRCAEDLRSCPSVAEMSEDATRKENSCARDPGGQPPTVIPALVDKETNTDEAGSASVAVRPKDRSGLSARQRAFVRSSVIVRSQTFSPGERSQYVCRAGERPRNEGVVLFRLLTLQAVCQPVLRRTAPECPVRTSLDLELDLQASLTRQSRLNDELQALRGLRQKLEDLKAQGETDLPPGVLEDERFQRLLRQAEKQAEQSKEEQKQDLNAEKLMRQVSKDVCRLREQSRKVPRQVQSFRQQGSRTRVRGGETARGRHQRHVERAREPGGVCRIASGLFCKNGVAAVPVSVLLSRLLRGDVVSQNASRFPFAPRKQKQNAECENVGTQRSSARGCAAGPAAVTLRAGSRKQKASQPASLGYTDSRPSASSCCFSLSRSLPKCSSTKAIATNLRTLATPIGAAVFAVDSSVMLLVLRCLGNISFGR
ncbi:protein WWC2 [Camelus ferus]|nr:protein WWC2 [Camelus ferus]